MARMKQAPNFAKKREKLELTESLYNLYQQAEMLYHDAEKGLDSPGQEIEILRDVAIQALTMLGVSGEEIIEFLPETSTVDRLPKLASEAMST